MATALLKTFNFSGNLFNLNTIDSRFSPNMTSLSCLFSNPNSFLCNSKSNAHFSLLIHYSSTSNTKRLKTPCPKICDVLINKHQFSPELASLASSRLHKFTRPERADSVLSFLKDNSFTTSQLEKIVSYNPQILGFTINGLEFRFKLFQDLGLSPHEIAKMISNNQSILYSNLSKRIIPRLSMLKSLLGSNQEVARLLRKTAWFLTIDLERTLTPNVEILMSCEIPMELILGFLCTLPRCFLIKPDVMRKSVDKAMEIGVAHTSTRFIHAVNVLAYTSEGEWEVKLQTLRDLGFSDGDIFTMFRKQPMVFSASVKKMKHVTEALLDTGKYNLSGIVTCPTALGCSIEKRLEPRLQVLGVLESRNLIEKWPALSRVATLTNDQFFDRFIRPYCAEIGEEHIKKIYGDFRRKEIV